MAFNVEKPYKIHANYYSALPGNGLPVSVFHEAATAMDANKLFQTLPSSVTKANVLEKAPGMVRLPPGMAKHDNGDTFQLQKKRMFRVGNGSDPTDLAAPGSVTKYPVTELQSKEMFPVGSLTKRQFNVGSSGMGEGSGQNALQHQSQTNKRPSVDDRMKNMMSKKRKRADVKVNI